MKRYFNRKTIDEIRAKRQTIKQKAEELVYKYAIQQFKTDKANEYAKHGFARRVGTLRRCIENVFEILPPGTMKVPRRERLLDAQINLQSFIANVFGALDNLAWVLVHERGLETRIGRKKVGLRAVNKQVRESLSIELQECLDGIEGWLEYVTEYRDSLAHRIPLYVPPGGVLPRYREQYNELMTEANAASARSDAGQYNRLLEKADKLLVFQPLMTHSVDETTGHYAFHAQMIADFLTIEELGLMVLEEVSAEGGGHQDRRQVSRGTTKI